MRTRQTKSVMEKFQAMMQTPPIPFHSNIWKGTGKARFGSFCQDTLSEVTTAGAFFATTTVNLAKLPKWLSHNLHLMVNFDGQK